MSFKPGPKLGVQRRMGRRYLHRLFFVYDDEKGRITKYIHVSFPWTRIFENVSSEYDGLLVTAWHPPMGTTWDFIAVQVDGDESSADAWHEVHVTDSETELRAWLRLRTSKHQDLAVFAVDHEGRIYCLDLTDRWYIAEEPPRWHDGRVELTIRRRKRAKRAAPKAQ